MTKEEKELLLKDLCARLPYGVKINLHNAVFEVCFIEKEDSNIYVGLKENGKNTSQQTNLSNIKPYLRQMSSMTEEERNDYIIFRYIKHHEWDGHSTYTEYVEVDEINNYFDWLNAHHFDYRGLIEKGLALPAPKDMYKDE